MNEDIIVRNFSKTFWEKSRKGLTVLKDINLTIKKGEFFIFLGPSGSGKSTLLRVMSGLEKSYKGEVAFGADIQPSDISFVFQQFALLPWLSVSENVELGILARHFSEEIRKEKVMREVKRFGLEKFADAYPRELSGGMRQRVGLARAFVSQPKIIFMDEPFSELDSFTAEELRKEFLHIWRETHETVVMVTHLVEEAIELADRIAVLTPPPGRIEKVVVNPLSRPRNKRTLEFYQLEDRLYKLIRP